MRVCALQSQCTATTRLLRRAQAACTLQTNPLQQHLLQLCALLLLLPVQQVDSPLCSALGVLKKTNQNCTTKLYKCCGSSSHASLLYTTPLPATCQSRIKVYQLSPTVAVLPHKQQLLPLKAFPVGTIHPAASAAAGAPHFRAESSSQGQRGHHICCSWCLLLCAAPALNMPTVSKLTSNGVG